ncbi:alkaline phosphatase [Conexibacter woesei]|uniref:Alkaline phosphatase n=1 Tax=Conexibacter woesei (strain DSM 14684 / CCUG 47730 / CIP 108061 / JCM 11494 / NBRC 100937 / ID131577) TaxID=469383 RepID=D3FCN4_CONWI|nr:alkaline phosphatase [Conexibacter woesei]ADB49507.1 Alkaline phosphatase [Conexibacter woesei DSM 14684]
MNRRALSAIALMGVTGAMVAGGVAIGAGGDDDRSASLAAKIDPSKPRNVILLIGDGMGDSEVTIGRYYGKGAAGRLNMDALPFRGSSLHYVLRPGPGPSYQPNYAGDSAPTATAWSTGKRTQDGRLSQGPSTADNVPGSNAGYRTFMEIARDLGKATGNVSTAEITDATPAGPSSHISQRACQGPRDARSICPAEAKPNGLGSIAEQQVDEGFDLYLGGGRNRYLQRVDEASNPTVVDYAAARGYRYVTDAAGLAGVRSLAPGEKLLGLFTGSNMTTEFRPLYARTDAFYARGGVDPNVNGGSDATRCQETNRPAGEPSLAAMTQKAIDLLKDDDRGFVLQVEGASIDKRDHAADLCGQIGELLALDEAVGVAQEFQRNNPDTLIVVTADHSHTSQIISASSRPATSAAYATVQTVDGAPMRVAYGTADTGDGPAAGGSQAHTGAQVPVWASGPQAANIQGTIDQTDIFHVLNGMTPSRVAGPGVAGPAGAPGAPGVAGTNGSNGTDGRDGRDGGVGATGAAGSNGAPGSNGANGAPGVSGAPGANGKDGAAGPQGPAGRDAKVTCRLAGSKTVRCSVAYASARSKSAQLRHGGRTIARGTVSSKGRVTLRARMRLTKGSYTLIAGGRSAKLSLR